MASEINNPAAEIGSGNSGEKARRFRYSEPTAASATLGSGMVGIAEMPGGPKVEWTRIGWALVAAGACFLLLYPSDLRQLVDRWSNDSGWSHGFVVPLICVFLIRLKWETLRRLVPRGSWMGLAVLTIGVCGQILFRATGLPNMSTLSIIVVLLGAVLFIFGWDYLKILWLPICYLGFAFPPPPPLYVRITTPMQFLAAELGVQLLPLFGCEASRTGTVIHVMANGTDFPLSVEEACAGMKMLVAFFALAVALAYSTDRPVWQKLTLAACALPIAIICNGLRVTLTGVLAVRVGGQWAEGKAHEYFGLLMLAPAMLMQLGVGWILDHIFVEMPDKVSAGGAA